MAALIFGRLFDRIGFLALAIGVLASAFFAPLVFLTGTVGAAIGLALWGIGMGAQESIIRAAVGAMVPSEWRGTAYGVFNAGYGLAWFLGSASMGVLYGISLPAMVAFSMVAQFVSLPFFYLVIRGNWRVPKSPTSQ